MRPEEAKREYYRREAIGERPGGEAIGVEHLLNY